LRCEQAKLDHPDQRIRVKLLSRLAAKLVPELREPLNRILADQLRRTSFGDRVGAGDFTQPLSADAVDLKQHPTGGALHEIRRSPAHAAAVGEVGSVDNSRLGAGFV
jgi:hypothetical protein